MKVNLKEVRQLIRKEIVLGLVKEAVQKAYLSEQSSSRDEKNKELLKRYQEGDPSALSQFIEANKGLVIQIAKQFAGSARRAGRSGMESNLELDDLTQAGYEGLVNAVNKFDPTRDNANLGGSMRNWIKQAISQQLKLSQPVSVKGKGGRDIRTIQNSFSKRYYELKSELGRDPSDEEMAASLGVDLELMKQVRSVGGTSTDMPLGDEGGQTIGDSLTYQNQASPEDSVLQQDFTNLLSRFEDNLSKLSDKLAVKVLKGELTNQAAADQVAAETGKNYTRAAMNLRVKKMKGMLLKFLGEDGMDYADALEKNAAA